MAQRTDARALGERCREAGVQEIFVHAPYLINVASDDPSLAARSTELLQQTIAEASRLGVAGVILHPGSHRGVGLAQVLERWRQSVSSALVPLAAPTKLYLENTAGGGGSMGRSPAELALLLEALGEPESVSIAIDTQHLFAAGYDLRDERLRQDLVAELRERFGPTEVMHVNDSMTECGSLHDRHANLGEGAIGEDAIARFVMGLGSDTAAALLEVPGAGTGPRPEDVARLSAALSSLRQGSS